MIEPDALTEPRFELRQTLSLPSGDNRVFTFAEGGNRTADETIVASATSRIVEQSGFKSGELNKAFRVGNDIEITYTSAQEFLSPEIIRQETALERTSPGTNLIYWDRVFKTFVIVDAGA